MLGLRHCCLACIPRELVLKIRTSQQLQAVFREAKAVLAGKAEKTFVPESLDDWQAFDVILERSLLAYTIDEFKSEFGCLPESIGIDVCDWQDERGEAVKLVFLADPAQPQRRVRLENRAGLLLQKKVSTVQEQLRPRQSADLLKTILQKRVKSDPWSKPSSAAEVRALAEEGKAKEAKIADELEKQRTANEAPPLQGSQSADMATGDHPLDEEPPKTEVVDSIAPTVFSHYSEDLFSQPQKRNKKGACRGRGSASAKRRLDSSPVSKAKKKAKQGKNSFISPSVPAEDRVGEVGDQDAASTAGSGRTAVGKRSHGAASVSGSTAQGQCSQAMKYVADLDTDLALAGHALKVPLYHSKRWMASQAAAGETDSAEYVTLSAKVDLIKNCIKLWELLGGNPTPERQKLLEEVMRCTHSLPLAFCARHLTAMVKEEPLKTEASVQQWLTMIQPDLSGDVLRNTHSRLSPQESLPPNGPILKTYLCNSSVLMSLSLKLHVGEW